jgi:transposase, IS5 family
MIESPEIKTNPSKAGDFMQPKNLSAQEAQGDLFRSRLDQILNNGHPLFQLARQIDWSVFDTEFGQLFVENVGRPGLPTRLIVGLHYLKHTFNESDESVVERFLENPYWQYFCGFEYFQHILPLDPSSLVRWRKRLGPDKLEKLLVETLETAKRGKLLIPRHVERVNVDTTVQEKAVAFPTDARLYQKTRRALVRAAKERDIDLRQNYERLGKEAFVKQNRYAHARQFKRARKQTRKLRTFLGRVIRDIQRKCQDPDEDLSRLLTLAERVFSQMRNDSNKVYSVHAPEVECIAKGKAHKRYEFGCKVAMVTSSIKNWVLAIDALHGNPFDGHTLKQSLEQVKRITGWQPLHAYCDRGYRGAGKEITDTAVHLAGKKKRSMKPGVWRWYARRSAIEPIFGHLKSDHRLERNHLKGKDGDRMNAILSGCGFNLRKLLGAFFLSFLCRLIFGRVEDHPCQRAACLSPVCSN